MHNTKITFPIVSILSNYDLLMIFYDIPHNHVLTIYPQNLTTLQTYLDNPRWESARVVQFWIDLLIQFNIKGECCRRIVFDLKVARRRLVTRLRIAYNDSVCLAAIKWISNLELPLGVGLSK